MRTSLPSCTAIAESALVTSSIAARHSGGVVAGRWSFGMASAWSGKASLLFMFW